MANVVRSVPQPSCAGISPAQEDCLFVGTYREEHREPASLAQCGLDLDAALQSAHDDLADGEAESRTLFELVFLEETAEYHLAVAFREADARVLDIEFCLLSVREQSPAQGDRALRRELPCIGEEVRKYLRQAVAIHLYGGIVGGFVVDK